jgi:thiamine transport system ATP-binding protein
MDQVAVTPADVTPVAVLQVADVCVSFDGRAVLDHVSLEVGEHEVVALLGPSGSGKSTLLRVIAGLQEAQSGTVRWAGEDITRVPTHRRRFGFVFQDEQLFPHRNVAANIGFGLRMTGAGKAEIAARVAELLELVGLGGFGDRDVTTLSGGEAKRVALARALAPQPRLLLLDEPLTGLDAELHDRLADDLRAAIGQAGIGQAGIPAILVTHDPAEAARIADRVVHLGDLGILGDRGDLGA